MKINIITDNQCFNMDGETGNVIRNMDVKWNLINRVFYIKQDGALKLPENGDYVVDFDLNEVKAGDIIFVSYRIDGKMHIILLKDKSFTNLVNLFEEDRKKQREDDLSCGDCCPDSCEKCGNSKA